jgi:hypothetical protein
MPEYFSTSTEETTSRKRPQANSSQILRKFRHVEINRWVLETARSSLSRGPTVISWNGTSPLPRAFWLCRTRMCRHCSVSAVRKKSRRSISARSPAVDCSQRSSPSTQLSRPAEALKLYIYSSSSFDLHALLTGYSGRTTMRKFYWIECMTLPSGHCLTCALI